MCRRRKDPGEKRVGQRGEEGRVQEKRGEDLGTMYRRRNDPGVKRVRQRREEDRTQGRRGLGPRKEKGKWDLGEKRAGPRRKKP